MRPYRGARSLRAARFLLPALVALAATGGALAQTPLAMTTHTVTALTQPSAVEHDFTVPSAGSYSVTLIDLGSKLPTAAPLTSVAMAVTQGATLVGTVSAPGTPITFNAAANTTYTVHVVGLPGTTLGSGPIEEDVATGGAPVSGDTWIDTLTPPPQQQSGTGVLNDGFTMSAASGTYTVTLTDLMFPAALSNPNLLLIDTTSGSPVALLSPSTLSASASLNQGDSYQIVAFAQEGSGAAGGLFAVSISGAVYGRVVPVGGVTLLQSSVSGQAQSTFTLGASGATVTLADLSVPTVPLASVGAAVVDATAQTVAASVTTTGAQSISAPSASDTYEVFAYAVPDATANDGSYSVAVQQGTSFPFFAAQAVSSSSTIQAFTFNTSIAAAGSYTLTLTDFKFPVQLTSDALAAVQNGQPPTSIGAAGKVSASLSQGPVTLLAFGSEGGQPASPGLMGIDLSPAGGGSPVFDVTEGIGTGFSSTSFTVISAQSVQANVADLKFPNPLTNLDLAVTSGTTLVGSISSAGSAGNFPFQAAANTTYNVNVLAQPAAPANQQQPTAGTYAMSVYAAPAATLTASSASVASGGTVTLKWASQNTTTCTASASPTNSAWAGSETPSGGPVTTSAITATTTFSLSCTGGGGTASATATVSVRAAANGGGGHGGGGSLDPELLLGLAAILGLRVTASRFAAWRARSDRP